MIDLRKLLVIMEENIQALSADCAKYEGKDGTIADKDIVVYTHQLAVASALQVIGSALMQSFVQEDGEQITVH